MVQLDIDSNHTYALLLLSHRAINIYSSVYLVLKPTTMSCFCGVWGRNIIYVLHNAKATHRSFSIKYKDLFSKPSISLQTDN